MPQLSEAGTLRTRLSREDTGRVLSDSRGGERSLLLRSTRRTRGRQRVERNNTDVGGGPSTSAYWVRSGEGGSRDDTGVDVDEESVYQMSLRDYAPIY